MAARASTNSARMSSAKSSAKRVTLSALKEKVQGSHVKRRCVETLRKEISPENKRTYIKAFLVWILFTVAGWISIPEKALPFFSHCVGFGFFLVITTRRTRWLGALAIGGIVFTYLLFQTLPIEWVNLVSQSAGYSGLVVMLVFACFWRVVPQEIRTELSNELINTRNEMLNRAHESLEQLRLSLHIESPSEPPTDSSAVTPGSAGTTTDSSLDWPLLEKSVSPTSSTGVGTSPFALTTGGTDANNLTERERYILIIQQLDQKLVDMDKEMTEMRKSFAAAVKKISSKLDVETELRLKSEKTTLERDETIQTLRTEIESWKRRACGAVCSEMKRSLALEQQKCAQSVQSTRDEFALLLLQEKSMRGAVEEDVQRYQEHIATLTKDCARLQAQLTLADSSGLQHELQELRQVAAAESNLRKSAEQEVAQLLSALSKAKETHEQLQHSSDVAYKASLQQLEAQLEQTNKELHSAKRALANREVLETLSLDEVTFIEQEQAARMQLIKEVRTVMLEREHARLKAAHDELQDKILCRVCLSQSISVIVEPCGHACLCKECSGKLKTCPICRKNINKFRGFFV